MTLGRADLIDTLRLLLRVVEEADSAPPASAGIDEKAYKDALLAVAEGGVKLLQSALGVPADGIVGPITEGALDSADLQALVRELNSDAATPSADPSDELTPALRAEYRALYATAKIRTEYAVQVASITSRVLAAEKMPEVVSVSKQTGVPARVICIMQALEANLNFGCHLHNGDSLKGRTVNVPSGRPPPPLQPPFIWSASALDALRYQNFDEWHDWSIEGCAYTFERMNGWGYRLYHPEVKSPYLWSFSTIYTSGKYVADGEWDPNAVSEQCGAMTILKAMGGVGV